MPTLVALTLLVSGAVAAVPAVVVERHPRQRALPPLPPQAEVLRVVQAPAERWFLNGAPIERGVLAQRLARRPGRRQVRFLPSAALPIATVAASLRWLRQQSVGPVSLELPPPLESPPVPQRSPSP